MPAAGDSYFDGILVLIEVTVRRTEDFVPRTVVASRHTRRGLRCDGFVSAKASLDVYVWVGKVHFHDMEFKRIGGYIVKGIFRTGTYIVRVYYGIYRIGFASDGYSRSINKERQYPGKKEAEYLFHDFFILIFFT